VWIDFERLATLLERRLQPVVPSRVRLRAEGAVVVMWTEGFQGRTRLTLDDNAHAGNVEEALEDPIGTSLTQVADESSEATTDRYECDFAFEDDGIRIWFGAAPRTRPPDVKWRDLLPELPPIPIGEILTDAGA
jgi:hypothetical protein